MGTLRYQFTLMIVSTMDVKVLHNNKQYLDECADVLNEEWKRSKTARLHSLEKSCDSFPINLVFLENGKVIGHSRISIIQGKQNSCFIESVVVKKCCRGKGYGRKLMEASENFVNGKGFKTMYLSTHDKQDFYKHLGYVFCQPVISFGTNAANLPEEFINKFLAGGTNDVNKEEMKLETSREQNNVQSNEEKKSFDKIDSKSCDSTGMPVLPPPPPPPPPPLPPQSVSANKSKPEVIRWDSSAISWMKKDLI